MWLKNIIHKQVSSCAPIDRRRGVWAYYDFLKEYIQQTFCAVINPKTEALLLKTATLVIEMISGRFTSKREGQTKY